MFWTARALHYVLEKVELSQIRLELGNLKKLGV